MLTRYRGTWSGHFGTKSLDKQISDVFLFDIQSQVPLRPRSQEKRTTAGPLVLPGWGSGGDYRARCRCGWARQGRRGNWSRGVDACGRLDCWYGLWTVQKHVIDLDCALLTL
jgi:hypothetical protein